jgi:hypothetical protein
MGSAKTPEDVSTDFGMNGGTSLHPEHAAKKQVVEWGFKLPPPDPEAVS